MRWSCLAWYDVSVAPYLVHAGCSARAFDQIRRRMMPLAEGTVVEVGFGSGLNLGHYDHAKVKRFIGIDPDVRMLAIARRESQSMPFAVEAIRASGESLPLDDALADTVVVTYALCTIARPEAALAEIRRVLRPSSRLIFIEHGLAEEPLCRRWQGRLNLLWGRLAGGCRLTRDPPALIRGAGFRLETELKTRFPLPFWQLGSHYTGTARPVVP